MARLGAGEVRHMNRDGRPGERPFPLAPCLAGLSLVISGPVFLMAYVACSPRRARRDAQASRRNQTKAVLPHTM